jgi:L-iditol 2-dehydrogenase
MNEVYPRAIDIAERGAVQLAPLITQRLPLTRADEAFRLAAGRTGLKVLVEPGS